MYSIIEEVSGLEYNKSNTKNTFVGYSPERINPDKLITMPSLR